MMASINKLEMSLLDAKNSLEEVNTKLKKISGREEKIRKSLNSNAQSPLPGRLYSDGSYQDTRYNDDVFMNTDVVYPNKRYRDDPFLKNDVPRGKRLKQYSTPKTKQRLEDSEILKISQKPVSVNTDDDVTNQRNRRLIGTIMTTLKKFQETEVQNSTSNKEQRRREIAQKKEREEQMEREKAANEKRDLLKNKQRMQEQIMCFEERIELEKMNKDWDVHSDQLSNFIQTKSKPKIFYVPKRHNRATKHLLNSTKSAMNDQKKARRRKFDKLIHNKYKIDFHTKSKS